MAKPSPDPATALDTTGALRAGEPAAAAGRPTWRYRMLLLAIGSATTDGSDVTPSDRDILLRMDQHLLRRAVDEGEAAAQHALMALVEILQGDSRPAQTPLH